MFVAFTRTKSNAEGIIMILALDFYAESVA